MTHPQEPSGLGFGADAFAGIGISKFDPDQGQTLEQSRRDDILHRFGNFDLDIMQRTTLIGSRAIFRGIAERILDTTKPGREQAAALTALEEAKYWTNQSIAKDGVPNTQAHDDTSPTDILALHIDQDDVPGITTLGGYLAELLIRLLDEEEGFDPKRPFGNSGWQSCIEDAIALRDPAVTWDDLRDAITQRLAGRDA